MADHVISLALSAADPSIPWPARGSAGRELIPRAGWELRTIPVLIRGKPATMEAMCRGELAVNVMIEDEGFAISLASCGCRLSYNGNVFAQCEDAMDAAEALSMSDETWENVPAHGYTDLQRTLLRGVVEAAERRGQIMMDRVFPSA